MANISKLTSDQISEMRRLFEEGATQASLAKRYNVSITTVSKKLKPKLEIELPVPTYVKMQEAFDSTPEELGRAAVEAVKKKEPPKRRIVGVNI
jgi:DNA-binding transcriptional regulator LsrR (DeoR family)